MLERISKEAIVLIILGGILCVGITVGIVRHVSQGKVELVTNADAPLKINLNNAGVQELCRLPGIGPGLASRIVDYRCEHGDFLAPESLLGVPGIGQAKLAEIKPYLELR